MVQDFLDKQYPVISINGSYRLFLLILLNKDIKLAQKETYYESNFFFVKI